MQEIKEQERRLEMQKKIIEEERQRLLREHAPQLLGYLPKVRSELLSTHSVSQLHRHQLRSFSSFCMRVMNRN